MTCMLTRFSSPILALTVCIMISVGSHHAHADEPLLGEVKMFAGNFAPRGYAFCDGQLLPIASNTALFSILGTTYGGDGRTTFALPDLRGRAPIHAGNSTGPGLTPIKLGQKGGSYGVKKANPDEQGVGTMTPTLGINYIIALQGIYSSRN